MNIHIIITINPWNPKPCRTKVPIKIHLTVDKSSLKVYYLAEICQRKSKYRQVESENRKKIQIIFYFNIFFPPSYVTSAAWPQMFCFIFISISFHSHLSQNSNCLNFYYCCFNKIVYKTRNHRKQTKKHNFSFFFRFNSIVYVTPNRFFCYIIR